MRLFHVNSTQDATTIAAYLIWKRIPFQVSYLLPTAVVGPIQYRFKLPRHIATTEREENEFHSFLRSMFPPIRIVNDDVSF